MAGLLEIPGDSAILVPGENIKKVMVGVDIGVAELLLAKDLGTIPAGPSAPSPGLMR